MTSKFWKSWYSHSPGFLNKFWSSRWTSLSGFSCDQVGRQTRGGRGPKGRCWHHQLCFSCWHKLYFLSSFLHFHDGGRNQAIPRSLHMGLGTITYSPLLSTSFWIRKSFSTKRAAILWSENWRQLWESQIQTSYPTFEKTFLALSLSRNLLL